MDSFLDTNVIFNYSNCSEDSKKIIKKCYFYIINKKERFIVCLAVLEELSEIINKRARMHKVVVNKIKNTDYSLENNFLIPSRDIPFAKKLYERFKNDNLEKVAEYLRSERRASEIAIQKFLENDVDEKVIPIEQIETELVNKIHDIINNHVDCKIVASALQLMKERKNVFLFVTADSKDFDPNVYEYLKEHFKINYSKENYKFPELLNLMYQN